MKLYIDCGSHNGETLDCETLFGYEADYKIAFEPNLFFMRSLENTDANEVYGAAVWDKNGQAEFCVDDSPEKYASTLMKSKTTWNQENVTIVDTLDFAEFIRDVYDRLEVSELVVRLDIEGAEMVVLEHLHKTETDKLITRLYVEFHHNKVTEFTTTKKLELMDKMRCYIEEIR